MALSTAERKEKEAPTASSKVADLSRRIADANKSITSKRTSLRGAEVSEQRARDREEVRRRQKEKDHAREVARLSRPTTQIRYVEVQLPKPEPLRVLYLTANPHAMETTIEHPDGGVAADPCRPCGGKWTNSFAVCCEELCEHARKFHRVDRGPASGAYRPNQYGNVILPLTIVRRLDCILEPDRDTVPDLAARSSAAPLAVTFVEPTRDRCLPPRLTLTRGARVVGSRSAGRTHARQGPCRRDTRLQTDTQRAGNARPQWSRSGSPTPRSLDRVGRLFVPSISPSWVSAGSVCGQPQSVAGPSGPEGLVSTVGVLRRDQLLGTGRLPLTTRVTTTDGEWGSVMPCCWGLRTKR